MIMDMTTGNPVRRMLRFFFPVLIGQLLQQLCVIADGHIVSKYLGLDAFAGVSAAYPLYFMFIGFTLGMCSGFSIPVAQEFGADNLPMLRKCFAQAARMGALISVGLAAVTAALTPQILRLMATPEDILGYSRDYIRIIFIGAPATVLYNLLSGAMRAVGDGRTPLCMLICCCALNVALDLLFMLPLGMGVEGAAIASVLAQLISGLLCALVIRRKFPILHPRREEWRRDRQATRRVLGIGVPMGLQFSITAVGSVLIQSAVNGLGSSAVAAYGAGQKIENFLNCPFEATAVTIATYCGQNLGARRIDRVRTGVRMTTLAMFGYCAVIFALVEIFGRPLISLFVDPAESDIFGKVAGYLRTVSAMFFLLVLVQVYRNAIQGLGHGRISMLGGALELAGRSVVAFVLVRIFAFGGVCFTDPVAWLCADFFLVPMYCHIVRKLEREIGQRVLSQNVYPKNA